MTQNTDTRTVLSAADAQGFCDALDRPAQTTPSAIKVADRYRERIADGSLIVADDAEDTACWARDAFAALKNAFAAAGPVVQERLSPEEIAAARADLVRLNADALAALRASPGHRGLHPRIAALRAEGAAEVDPASIADDQVNRPDADYDADLELARHMVFDMDQVTDWALDTLERLGPPTEQATARRLRADLKSA